MATILGTLQSTLTKFPYLRKEWQRNTEEERLLGVSLTGIMDNPLTATNVPELKDLLEELKQVAVDTNKIWAEKLGIPQSTAVTAVKPSGTVSQLVDSASGIHGRHSPFYIRSVRADIKDPLTQFMIDQGIPYEPCVMKPDQTMVFFFPMKSPEQSVGRDDLTAIDQLEIWKTYQEHWCEHKPSITVSVREHEWAKVGGWVYDNFDMLSGVSFLPHSEHTYRQAPYEACSEERYLELKSKMPEKIDWDLLSMYEAEDHTSGMQTLACASGDCEIVDLV